MAQDRIKNQSFTPKRIEELEQLEKLLFEISGLKHMNLFDAAERLKGMGEIAQKLNTSSISKLEFSFIDFLKEKATNRYNYKHKNLFLDLKELFKVYKSTGRMSNINSLDEFVFAINTHFSLSKDEFKIYDVVSYDDAMHIAGLFKIKDEVNLLFSKAAKNESLE